MSLRALLASFILISGTFAAAYAQDATNSPETNDSAQPADTFTPPPVQRPGSATPSPSTPEAPVATDGTVTTAPPAVVIPKRDVIAEAAIRYGTYQADVGLYNRMFNSQDDVAEASRVLGTHNPEMIVSGWLAYSAILASESDVFAAEVRKIAAHHGRDRTLTGFENDIRFALTLDGSQAALGYALTAGQADANRLKRIGNVIVTQSRGELQSMGWANAKLKGDSHEFVEDLQAASIAGRPVSGNISRLFEGSRIDLAADQATALGTSTSLWDSVPVTGTDFSLPVLSETTTPGRTSVYRNPDNDFINSRITTLAAYRILGETQPGNTGVAKALTDKEITGGLTDCVTMTQFEYRGCLVGNYKVFERVFCIGEHAVTDVGRCIGDISQ